ncbi:MAG: 2-oxoglutarate dehydrogenase E1 component [Alphaproteobacteria bacterium]
MVSRLEKTSFLTGANATFIAELYQRFLTDPKAVDESWARFFRELDDDSRAALHDLTGPSWAPRQTRVIAGGRSAAGAEVVPLRRAEAKLPVGVVIDHPEVRAATLDSVRALMLIRAYRARGHLMADLDPLGLTEEPYHPELDPKTYGFAESDMDRPIFIDHVLGMETATMREIVAAVQKTYCDKIGVEFMHIMDPDRKAWIQQRIEGQRNHTDFTAKGRRTILERIVAGESFEQFLDRRYTGTKRFGLEGGEAVIPAIEQIIKRGGQLGVREIVIGMAHRGRLNMLANVLKKPFAAIFSEFQGNPAHPDSVQGSGDVKYHLGASADRTFDDNVVHLSLTPNPSHLEAVNTVVIGKVRAKQAQRGDTEREQVMAILLHGDAAFSGQGLAGETLDLSELKGYRTGGTIHIVINNQIGFTTSPAYSRSSPYPSDVAKKVQAPIFHVNGDDPEAVVHVARIAVEYRYRFKSDVVIDMFCYRRFGHNEADEPAFTQPLMYKRIADHPTTRQIYADRLITEGVLTREEADDIVKAFRAELDAAFEAAKSYKVNKADWLEGAWTGMEPASGDDRRGDTAVPLDQLREVGHAVCKIPAGFNANPKLVRLLKQKEQMIETGEGIDWATAEALAFGTLVSEGTPVRLSGQDSGRGTFSQRHAVLVDQQTEERHIPLNHVAKDQGHFEVVDSPLSEAGVLGFDYGYSVADPHTLVLWEAQFGDFANGAQVIIDQFVTVGELKWFRMSGLVMLLPHGYEGQGPEHSSARLERYLQLCAEDNIQVANCTTPANYFHILRRQMRRRFRKPLVLMTPKSLLRHKLAISRLDEMGPGTTFHRILPETDKLAPNGKVRRVVLCTGKVYYDLYEERMKRGIKDVALVRIEQIYPFPKNALGKELRRHPNADVVWCQEEPHNMGSWFFVEPRIRAVLADIGHACKEPVYAGRAESAAPATGLYKRHDREQAELVDAALTVK